MTPDSAPRYWRVVTEPLMPTPHNLDWQYLPKLNCSIAIWGAAMNDGRSETYLMVSPESAIKRLEEKE